MLLLLGSEKMSMIMNWLYMSYLWFRVWAIRGISSSGGFLAAYLFCNYLLYLYSRASLYVTYNTLFSITRPNNLDGYKFRIALPSIY